MAIWNRDWENWTTAMAHEAPSEEVNPKALRPHYLPRPGHADLPGAILIEGVFRALKEISDVDVLPGGLVHPVVIFKAGDDGGCGHGHGLCYFLGTG